MRSHVLERRDANSCTYTRTSARIVSRLMTAHDAWTRSVIENKIKRLEKRVDMLNEEKMKLLAESHGDGRLAEGDDGSGEDDENYETDEEDGNQDAEELETSEAEERPRTRLQGERDQAFERLRNLCISEWKQILKKPCLKVGGRKQELIDRIVDH